LKTDLIKASSIEAIGSILRIHILPFVGTRRLDELTDAAITDLKEVWLQGGHQYVDQYGKLRKARATSKPKTWNNRLTVLLSMYTYAVKRKPPVLERMPCSIELLPVDVGDEAKWYDHETYERLVEASREVDPRVHAVVLLGGEGGLRRGEVLGLNLTGIDFRNGQFFVRRNVFFQKGKYIEDTPKGGKSKPVPCTPRLLAALKACRHLRGERLLYDDEGAPVTPKLLKLWIQRAEKQANLEQTGRFHILRHTFCSHAAVAGVPARTIQEAARHSDLGTTQRYMHLSPSALKEGIEMLARSRAAGGAAVLGHAPLVPPRSPNDERPQFAGVRGGGAGNRMPRRAGYRGGIARMSRGSGRFITGDGPR
jgi:integrase